MNHVIIGLANEHELEQLKKDYPFAGFQSIGSAPERPAPVETPRPPEPPQPPEPPKPPEPPTKPPLFFFDSSQLPDQYVTSEAIKTHPLWVMTSGSLYAQNGWLTSGLPTVQNNSSIFRLVTRRSDFGDVAVSCKLLLDKFVVMPKTPAVDWDGIHIWLRYQSPYHIYYASIARRDGAVIIKKKVPGGPSNNGTYYNLSAEMPVPFKLDTVYEVKATVQNVPGGVEIKLYSNGKLLVSAIDKGLGGAPIIKPGATGIRGDNCQFSFADFKVEAL